MRRSLHHLGVDANNWTRTQTLVHLCLLFTLQSQDTCIVVDVSVTALPNSCSYNNQELYSGCFLVTNVTISNQLWCLSVRVHQDRCLIVLHLQVRRLLQSDHSCLDKNTLLSFKVGHLVHFVDSHTYNISAGRYSATRPVGVGGIKAASVSHLPITGHVFLCCLIVVMEHILAP